MADAVGVDLEEVVDREKVDAVGSVKTVDPEKIADRGKTVDLVKTVLQERIADRGKTVLQERIVDPEKTVDLVKIVPQEKIADLVKIVLLVDLPVSLVRKEIARLVAKGGVDAEDQEDLQVAGPAAAVVVVTLRPPTSTTSSLSRHWDKKKIDRRNIKSIITTTLHGIVSLSIKNKIIEDPRITTRVLTSVF